MIAKVDMYHSYSEGDTNTQYGFELPVVSIKSVEKTFFKSYPPGIVLSVSGYVSAIFLSVQLVRVINTGGA